MKRTTWFAGLLAAVLWSSIGAASPEYRKDPAVRAAVERELKTSDPAEIRRRWGALTDLADKVWIQDRDGYRGWVYFRWVVPGAVMEFFVGFCPSATKCEAGIRQALLVHNPKASTERSFSNPFVRPAFDVLWDNGWNHSLGLVHDSHSFVHLNGVMYRFHAESGKAMLNGAPYKAMPVAELAALTKYDFKPVPGQAAPVAVVTPAPKAKLPAGQMGVSLGARIAPSNPQELEPYFSLVTPGGLAEQAGIRTGDLIRRVGDIERPTQSDVLRAIVASPGKTVQFVVQREGKSTPVAVKLGETTLPGPCFVIGFPDYQYDGECKDGFAHGRGEATFTGTTARYVGDFVQGAMEGRGAHTTPTQTYEGSFLGNMRHGRGKITFADGRPEFEGEFAHGHVAGLKAFPEALFVCTRPDAAGKFNCDAPDRAGLRGESPQAVLANTAQSCPSQRRLPSRTHLVWGCGFAATNAPGAADRSVGVETRGRGSYQCLEREASCKRTEPL